MNLVDNDFYMLLELLGGDMFNLKGYDGCR